MVHNPFNMGSLIEGVVEQDPLTNQYNIRTAEGITFSVQKALEALEGKEVRFTLVSFEALQKLAEMVENVGGGQVAGIGTLGRKG